jgi:hypothetical protein
VGFFNTIGSEAVIATTGTKRQILATRWSFSGRGARGWLARAVEQHDYSEPLKPRQIGFYQPDLAYPHCAQARARGRGRLKTSLFCAVRRCEHDDAAFDVLPPAPRDDVESASFRVSLCSRDLARRVLREKVARARQ